MRPRWSKVVADLVGNKVRSLLVIASIAVGLFAVGMIVTVHGVLKTDMEVSYRAVNPANIQIRADSFNDDFVKRVRNLPGVKDAYGVWIADMRLQTAPGELVAIQIKALPNAETMNINKIEVVTGKWPPAEREIVLDQSKFDEAKAQIGDFITLKLPSGKTRQLKLVGMIHDQTIGSASGGGGFFLAPIQGYINYDSLEWLEQAPTLNELFVTVLGNQDNLANIDSVAERVNREFDNNAIVTYSSVSRRSIDHPNVTYLDAIGAVLILLGFLVVFLSGFLITNTLGALVNQQTTQIGVMKTVGANRSQIVYVYIVLILVYSAIALAISLPSSYAVAYQLVAFLAQRINFNVQPRHLVPNAVYLQVLIAIIVPQVAGFVPIWQGTSITIQEALSGIGKNEVDDQGRFYRGLMRLRRLSRPLVISLRNTFRRRVRLILTLITLTLGGAIFIATFNVRGSLDSYVTRLRRYFIADVNLTFNRPYRINNVAQDVGSVPGVGDVEGWAAARAEIVLPDGTSGEAIQLLAPPEDSRLLEPIVIKGRWLEHGDKTAITLSELFMEKFPGLKVGDPIRLKVNGNDTDWTVVGFFQFAGKSGGLFAYTTYDQLSRLTNSVGRSTVFRVVGNGGAYTLQQQEALGRSIETRLEELGYQVADVRAGLALQDSTSKGLNILTTFLLIMALLMAVVGSIGLMGTMSLNVLERVREIGVMRAIGASDRAITNLVIVEGMLIGIISWFLGCLLSIPISKIMSDIISGAIFGAASIFTFSVWGPLIWFGLVMLLAVLASVLPARNAASLTIREVLSYE
jgi:putative ABC transport system permease protein